MKTNLIENNQSDMSVSIIVDNDMDNHNELDNNYKNFEDHIQFDIDENCNIKYSVLKEGFLPGLELLKQSFKNFASKNTQHPYNLLCENFIVHLINNLNFYEVLKENSFSKNIENKTIGNPTAFIIFFRIPEEKLKFFQKYYKVEEFDEGEHLIDENKKDKALPIMKVFAEKIDLEFLYNYNISHEEYKNNILSIFSDLKNQNVIINLK